MNQQRPAFPVAGDPPKKDGLAVASLCLGIGGMVCLGALLGVPAIICGHLSRGKIARSGGTLGGAGMALAGLILGYVSVPLTIIAVLVAAAMPAVTSAVKKGHQAKAVMQCDALEHALEAYAAEYVRYPRVGIDVDTGERHNANLVAVLRAQDNHHLLNPRRVVFFQPNAKDIVAGQVVDPWKHPLHITYPSDAGVEGTAGKAAGTAKVWSSGPNGINERGGGDDITARK